MPTIASHTVIRATLGGLVHDIGKIWAQSSGRGPRDTQFDCATVREHASFASCPSCRKRYRYAHAPLGANLLASSLPDGLAFLSQLAVAHHAGGSEAQTGGQILPYVVLGDHLSAGERDDQYDDDDDRTPSAEAVLLNPFSVARRTTPVPLTSQVQRARDALGTAARLAGGDEMALCEHLLGALEATASLVPSAFQNSVADISLASHLHLAGAFAGALAAGGVSPQVDLNDCGEPVATLVMGDISGIQQFIHRTASKGAARSLRSRSFYLTMLSHVVSRYVCESTGVTPVNVISASGGNFLAICPRGTAERMVAIGEEIDQILIDLHGPVLSVVLAAVDFVPRAPLAETYAEALQSLRRELAEAKARRYERSAGSLQVFSPIGAGGPLRACRSCGGDATDGTEDDDGRICSFCSSMEELGRALPRRGYLTIRKAGDQGAGGWTRVFQRLGYELELRAQPPSAPFSGAIFALTASSQPDPLCARVLPTGRSVPEDDRGGPLDFRELAEQSLGRPLLAVFKADVDDLGSLLTGHFMRDGRSVASPSRVATFSRFLSLFFEGRVNHVAAEMGIYVVFAGGDDVLAVGPWDKILEFATRVREEFAQWTGENPNFHLSAGISLGDASRPVMAGLEEAESLLAKAKGQPGKNSVGLLGHVFSWEEYREVLGWRDKLVGLIQAAKEEGRVARSLLQRLKNLENLWDPDSGTTYGPELWRAYYGLRRFAERYKERASDMEDIYRQACAPKGGLKLAVAARLAEFATTRRKGE